MKKYQKGMTLVELILYVALVSLFIGGAISFAWDIVYGRVKSNTQRALSQNLRIASERISYEIRNATAVSLPTSSSISLTLSDASRNPTVFQLYNGRLVIIYGSDCPNPPNPNTCYVTSNELTISSLTFTNLSTAGSTNIQFSITGSLTGPRQEYKLAETYQTAVEKR